MNQEERKAFDNINHGNWLQRDETKSQLAKLTQLRDFHLGEAMKLSSMMSSTLNEKILGHVSQASTTDKIIKRITTNNYDINS